MPAAKITIRPFSRCRSAPPAYIRLGELIHKHCAHDPALHSALFQGIPASAMRVDYRCGQQHAHAVGAHAVHLFGLRFHAAEKVPSAHYHAYLHAQCVDLGQLAGNIRHSIGIKAEAANPGKRLTRQLQHNPLIHFLSSIAYER